MSEIDDYVDHWIRISSKISGKEFWETKDQETFDGANIRQWDWDKCNFNKQWMIRENSIGGYTIENRHTDEKKSDPKKVVEYADHKLEPGTNIRQWHMDDKPGNKLWDFEFCDGYFKIYPHGTKNMAVEVEGKERGANIQLGKDQDTDKQKWTFEKALP